jgi:hypothetical protein
VKMMGGYETALNTLEKMTKGLLLGKWWMPSMTL